MTKKLNIPNIDDYLDTEVSPDQYIRISTANTGKKLSPERVEQLRQNALKQRHTEETKLKISENKKGIKLGPFTEEHKSNISKTQLQNGGNGPGKHCEETKNKISQSLSGRKYTAEHRAKISAGQKGGKGRQPLLTPHGVFKSRIEAIKNLTGIVLNVARLIDKSTKIKDSGYKYITREEYMMLTGKEI